MFLFFQKGGGEVGLSWSGYSDSVHPTILTLDLIGSGDFHSSWSFPEAARQQYFKEIQMGMKEAGR